MLTTAAKRGTIHQKQQGALHNLRPRSFRTVPENDYERQLLASVTGTIRPGFQDMAF